MYPEFHVSEDPKLHEAPVTSCLAKEWYVEI